MAVPVTGFVIASRRPVNRIGWLFLVAGLGLGLSGFANPYALHAVVANPGSLPAGRAFAWLNGWISVIPLAMLAFLFLLFPTGTCAPGAGGPPRGLQAARPRSPV
jgi:hypothetical protein